MHYLPLISNYYWGAILIGAVVGFLSGLLGKGGSALTTPVLRVFLETPQFFALASPLPAVIPTTLSASWAYRGRDLIDWGAVKIVCLWGIPATILGSWASQWVGGHALMVLTALFVMGLGVDLFCSRNNLPNDIEAIGRGKDKARALGVIAIGVGIISGLLANAGGILYGPLFIRWVRMPVKRALATSLFVSAILAVPGALTHWYLGHIDWRLVAALSVGTIPFSYLGARVAIYLRSATLVTVYGIALILFGVYDLTHTEHVLLFWK